MDHVGLIQELHRRELPDGGWSFSGSSQMSLETTCLASFSVLAEQPSSAPHVVWPLLHAQLSDGSWPSFVGDGEPSWTTALAICVLNSANDSSGARERGQSWLLKTKGREGGWFWRWKFKLADRAVRFDPDRYGWPWLNHGLELAPKKTDREFCRAVYRGLGCLHESNEALCGYCMEGTTFLLDPKVTSDLV